MKTFASKKSSSSEPKKTAFIRFILVKIKSLKSYGLFDQKKCAVKVEAERKLTKSNFVITSLIC